MKLSEVANSYGIDSENLANYLRYQESNTPGINAGIISVKIDSSVDLDGLVTRYKEYQAKKNTVIEEKLESQRELDLQKVQEQQKKQQALANMLITSGFNFDGYSIKKYSGYISGDDAISIDRGTLGIFSNATNVGDSLTKSLTVIRRKALVELKEAAYDLGCNAVIGVDFDYITLEPETANSSGGTVYLPYVFCVTANGNAVIIEKDDE